MQISKLYGNGGDKFALVTGSTDGIGKEYAFQLAKRGLNIILVSRTQSKLNSVAAELSAMYPSVKVETLALDFSRAADKDWQALSSVSKKFNVTILVNNVAMNHVLPTPLVDEEQSVIDNILTVNCGATLRVTKCILKDMLVRKQPALILNVGSFAGQVPTSMLQTYSASKSFLRTFSVALAQEVKSQGVHVEHHNTYFVVSNMSKISRASWMIPTAAKYVQASLSKLGRRHDLTPYPAHNLMQWAMTTLVPQKWLVSHTHNMQVSIRKRALKKAERQAKKE